MIRHKYNYSAKVSRAEQVHTPKGVSCTVPDQSHTIKEILKKFVSGVDPSLVRHGTFEKVPNLDAPVNLVNFDPTDSMTQYEKDCE